MDLAEGWGRGDGRHHWVGRSYMTMSRINNKWPHYKKDHLRDGLCYTLDHAMENSAVEYSMGFKMFGLYYHKLSASFSFLLDYLKST